MYFPSLFVSEMSMVAAVHSPAQYSLQIALQFDSGFSHNYSLLPVSVLVSLPTLLQPTSW